MLIHDILHSHISTEGTFHFVVSRRTDITGSLQIRDSFALFSYRKQETILLFLHIFHGWKYSCPAVFSPLIIKSLCSIGRDDVSHHSIIGNNTGCVFNALPSYLPPAGVSENLIPGSAGGRYYLPPITIF